LPEVLGLLLLARREVDLADLRHAVDEGRDLAAEALLDLRQSHERVLDGVVEEAGRDARDVEPHLGDDPGHLERVGEERLPRRAPLSLVNAGGELVRLLDDLHRRRRRVAADALDQVGDRHRPSRARRTIAAAISSAESPSVWSTTSYRAGS